MERNRMNARAAIAAIACAILLLWFSGCTAPEVAEERPIDTECTYKVLYLIKYEDGSTYKEWREVPRDEYINAVNATDE